jgi:ABC-type Fe3+ transport system substrate-binding protein
MTDWRRLAVGLVSAGCLMTACAGPGTRPPQPPNSGGSQSAGSAPNSAGAAQNTGGTAQGAAGAAALPPPAVPHASGSGATGNPTIAPAQAAALQAVVDGARREGGLSLVWGDGTLEGAEGIGRIAQAINQQHGLNLDVKFTPGPSMSTLMGRVAQEYQAGRAATSDVFVGYANNLIPPLQADALEAVDWASWAPHVQDPRLVAAGGTAVAVQSSLPGIAYSTSRLTGDLVPRGLDDLLKPAYQGRIASTPYAASFDQIAVPEAWGEQRATDYVEKLAGQIAGLIRCNELERLTSGEFDALVLACSQGPSLKARAQGAPIGYVIPADGPIMKPLYLAIPKNAAHPNAAKLFIDYLLSREGQDLVYASGYEDAHLVPGSKTAAQMEQLQATGVKFIQADVEFYQRNDEREQTRLLNNFVRILSQK